MHRKTLFAAAGLLSATFMVQALPAFAGTDVMIYDVDKSGDVRPTGLRGGTMVQPPVYVPNATIRYHGGPLILGTTRVYYIWYGNWTGNSAKTILVDLINGLNGSPYYNINTTYYNGSGTHVSNSVTLSGQTDDNYSRGNSLTDTEVQQVVSDAINQGRLPKDTNGVYFVLSSSDVSESSGFCSYYCGWHTWATISGSAIKYSFVGNADRCITACAWQSTGPNGNAGADGMASIIAHELEETVTDPQLNAWYFNTGNENADQCAWTFGSTYTVGNGALANMRLGSRDFLIQQNWNAGTGQRCRLTYP
jgi:hypothetical protein